MTSGSPFSSSPDTDDLVRHLLGTGHHSQSKAQRQCLRCPAGDLSDTVTALALIAQSRVLLIFCHLIYLIYLLLRADMFEGHDCPLCVAFSIVVFLSPMLQGMWQLCSLSPWS